MAVLNAGPLLMSKKPDTTPKATKAGRVLSATAAALVLFLLFVGGCVLPPALGGYAGYFLLGDSRGIRIGIVLGGLISVMLALNGFELPFSRRTQARRQEQAKALETVQEKQEPEVPRE